MREDKWVIRTVKDGRVKIYGHYYYPDTPIPSALEGRRMAFGRYRLGDGYEPFVCLWGTEAEFFGKGLVDEHRLYTNDVHELEWMWWNRRNDEREIRPRSNFR